MCRELAEQTERGLRQLTIIRVNIKCRWSQAPKAEREGADCVHQRASNGERPEERSTGMEETKQEEKGKTRPCNDIQGGS